MAETGQRSLDDVALSPGLVVPVHPLVLSLLGSSLIRSVLRLLQCQGPGVHQYREAM